MKGFLWKKAMPMLIRFLAALVSKFMLFGEGLINVNFLYLEFAFALIRCKKIQKNKIGPKSWIFLQVT